MSARLRFIPGDEFQTELAYSLICLLACNLFFLRIGVENVKAKSNRKR